MPGTQIINITGTYHRSSVEEFTFNTGERPYVVDLIPEELKIPGERLVIELSVNVRRANQGDIKDGLLVLASNPIASK